MNSVGNRIKTARQQLGLSQSALAEQLRVSQPTVANWENGSHAPRHSALSKLSLSLDTSTSWLLGDNLSAVSPTQTGALHHAPLLAWPKKRGDLDTTPVQGYITLSAQASRPFAIITQSEPMLTAFERGSIVIFDRGVTQTSSSGLYLVEQDGVVQIMRETKLSQDTTVLAKAIMVQQNL